MKTITITKNNHLGEEVWHYQGEIVRRTPAGLVAEAYFNRSDLEFNGVILKENDRFLELYLYEKWFNIAEIYDRDGGEMKAWYCNVARPVRLEEDRLYYDDLALDLLVFPDGHRMVLDEDEYSELDLLPAEDRAARAALKELESLFDTNWPLDVFSLL